MSIDLNNPATTQRLRRALGASIDARLDAVRASIRREIDRELALIPMRQARDHIKDVNH